MTDPITAWSTFALAVVTFISLWVSIFAVRASYRGIKEQTDSFKKQTDSFVASVSADLCLKLMDRFDNPVMLHKRNNAAKALIDGENLSEADEVFDFFEIVGLYVRRGVIDAELAHSMFFHWANLYWNAGKDYITESRQRTTTLYCDFEDVYKVVLQIEMHIDPRSRDINPTKADLNAFLRQELATLD